MSTKAENRHSYFRGSRDSRSKRGIRDVNTRSPLREDGTRKGVNYSNWKKGKDGMGPSMKVSHENKRIAQDLATEFDIDDALQPNLPNEAFISPPEKGDDENFDWTKFQVSAGIVDGIPVGKQTLDYSLTEDEGRDELAESGRKRKLDRPRKRTKRTRTQRRHSTGHRAELPMPHPKKK